MDLTNNVTVDHREAKGEKVMGNWPVEENFDRAVKTLERVEKMLTTGSGLQEWTSFPTARARSR
jgi:hypothetical protein